MGETYPLSYVETCSCGDVIVGYEEGDACPSCDTVIYE